MYDNFLLILTKPFLYCLKHNTFSDYKLNDWISLLMYSSVQRNSIETQRKLYTFFWITLLVWFDPTATVYKKH